MATEKNTNSKDKKVKTAITKDETVKIVKKRAGTNSSELKNDATLKAEKKVLAEELADVKTAKTLDKIAEKDDKKTEKSGSKKKVSAKEKNNEKAKSTTKAKNTQTKKPSSVKKVLKEEKATKTEDVSMKQVELPIENEETPTPTITVVRKKKILFAASECAPFASSGGLAEVIGSLPKALATDKNNDVRVIMPLYDCIPSDKRNNFVYIGNTYVPLSWRNQYCGIFSTVLDGVTIYFVDNEYYFKRAGLYGHFDDGERFAYFSKAVLESMSVTGFYPDILHCHDWQTSLSVIYLKTLYNYRDEYKSIRTVFTIHNIEYQGKYSLDLLDDLFGLGRDNKNLVEYDGCINLMKGAIECSDKVTTVSPTYANEIKDSFFAHGLENIIKRNEFKLCGILNGIDLNSYNSETDERIFANFSVDDMSGKKICKAELQKMLNLPIKPEVPIIAVISRLVSHKGLDLIKYVMEDILRENVQFVLLGMGDNNYENYFKDIANRYQGKCVSIISYNNDLSRKIYSGADIFLMPSKTEPCGLSQMIATRYATVPIVRETGGLADSIKHETNGGNGFTFNSYNAHDMLYVIKQAISIFKDNPDYWKEIMKRCLTSDFGWERSAKDYLALYDSIIY